MSFWDLTTFIWPYLFTYFDLVLFCLKFQVEVYKELSDVF